jgi:tetratricopeptide (TPR) repeat protein
MACTGELVGKRLALIRNTLGETQATFYSDEGWLKAVGSKELGTYSACESKGVPKKEIIQIANYFDISHHDLINPNKDFTPTLYQAVDNYFRRKNAKEKKENLLGSLHDKEIYTKFEIKKAVEKIINDVSTTLKVNLDTELADFSGSSIYVQNAANWMRSKKFEKAIDELDKAIAEDSGDGKAYSLKGKALGILGRYDEALSCFDLAIQNNCNESLTYYNRALTKEKLMQYKEAIKDYDIAISIEPSNAYYYCIKGWEYIRFGKFEECINLQFEAIKRAPNVRAFYFFLATIKSMIGSYYEAFVYANIAAFHSNEEKGLISVDDVDVKILMADIYFDSAEYEKAIRTYNEVIDEFKSDAANNKNRFISTKLNIASCYDCLNKNQVALKYVEDILKNEKLSEYQLYDSATILANSGKYDKAMLCCKKALGSKEPDAAFLQCRSFCYAAQEKYAEALKDIEKKIEIEPEDPSNIFQCGRLHYNLGNYNEAIASLHIALKNYKFSFGYKIENLYELLGLCHLQQHEAEKAIEYFNKCIEIDPEVPDYYFSRASCYYLLNRFESSINDCFLGYKLDNKSQVGLLAIATSYNIFEQHEKAQEYYSKAIEMGPDIEIYEDKGISNIKSKNYDAAIDDFNNALKLDKEHVPSILNKAHIYINLDKFELAINEYKKALKINPVEPNCFVGLARVSIAKRKYKDAKHYISKLDELKVSDPVVFIYASDIISDLPKISDTEKKLLFKFLDKADALSTPNDARSILARGYCEYIYNRSLKNALKCYARAYQIYPIIYKHELFAKWFSKKTKISAENKKELDALIKDDQYTLIAHWCRAELRYSEGLYESALIDIEKVIAHCIKPFLYQFYLRAKIYEKLGLKNMAVSVLEKCLEIDPNFKEAADKLKMLKKAKGK